VIVTSWIETLQLIRNRGSLEGILEFQQRRLQPLVRHAAREVSYYRDLFGDHGFSVSGFRGLEDLHRIPLHGKQEVRAAAESDRVARGLDPSALATHRTAGSTGQPVAVRRSRGEEYLLGFLRNRAEARFGIGVRDVTGSLNAQSLKTPPTLPGRLVQALGLVRRHPVSIRQGREATAAALVRLAPDVVRGYPSSLRHAAIALEALGESYVPPRLVLTGGESLLQDTRRQIESGFKAPLYECYAAHEFNLLASECPHGTGLLHTCDEGALIEVLHDGNPVQEGEQGEVVATALHSYAMPFIRFRTGDLAVRGPSPCPCGWLSGTLRSIVGRKVEYFLLPDGRWIHPASITGPMLVDEIAWVEQHQLVQEKDDRILMRILPRRSPPENGLVRLQDFARGVLGDRVHFRIELVDGCEQEPGKKFRPFITLSAPGEGDRPIGTGEHGETG